VAISARFGDVEASVYALGSWPHDRDIFNQGTTVPGSVQQGFGVGFKVGVFPAMLYRAVGLELDSNIHNSRLSFSNIANGQSNEIGRSDLLVFRTTINLVFRYPGETVRPYVGIGVGWSTGMLLNPNIAGRDDTDFDSARALGYQYLGGVEVLLTRKVFLFAEYRYFSANYHWRSLAVDFRDHNGLLGVGLRF
jgi:opacity protein-like surface antigen